MSKRLQVLLQSREYKEVQETAHDAGLTVSEWVRQVLQRATEGFSRKSPREKIESIRRFSSQYHFPIGDIDQVLAEIEKGYLES